MDNLTDQMRERFRALLAPVDTKFFTFCRSLTGSVEDGKDLRQDTLLRAFEKFHSFRDESFLGWLCTIARNLNKRHGAEAKKRRMDPLTEQYETISEYSSEDEILAHLDCEIMENFLKFLNPREREAFSLRFFQDLKIEEIRKVQGGTLAGAKTRLRRAVKKLERWLEPLPLPKPA